MCVCAESGGKRYDAELNQIPESENEVMDCDGNKDSSGSVKRKKAKKKVHWKHQTSGKK